jgi:hypothetical protein
MASIRRKSTAVALAFVGIAGLTLASAAQLNVNSTSLGAGTHVVASCDTDGVNVTFGNAYATNAYATQSVTLGGVAAACNGLAVRVTVADAAGVSLGELTGVIATGGTTTLPGLNVASANVSNVTVVISG